MWTGRLLPFLSSDYIFTYLWIHLIILIEWLETLLIFNGDNLSSLIQCGVIVLLIGTESGIGISVTPPPFLYSSHI